jgi:hypothetical protein
MVQISRKKVSYPVRADLAGYLAAHGRTGALPVRYADLARFDETTPVYDKRGRDTLWQTVLYPPVARAEIHRALVATYATLRVMGDTSLVPHLVTDRVDYCTWGNTHPFRIRILNTLNENFDYFYVKVADASRIYGLELEHVLSPNRIEFACDGDTLVEEHTAGVPGDVFVHEYLRDSHLDEVRLAKEFVKFNERCLLRLLGDMHAGNWVVDITPDFDETAYRIRPIDFDQQSYEGRCHVYLPQYYPANNPIVFLGTKCMTPQTVRQYQEEERSLMIHRARAEGDRLRDLLSVMAGDRIAPAAHVEQLADELAAHHGDPRFRGATTMGELVWRSMRMLGWS